MIISKYISIATTNTSREILIDPEDWEKLKIHLWAENSSGYARSTTTKELMHRIIIGAGSCEIVDHINHNRLDNRKRNLRSCTNSQNQMNRQPTKNKSSKYKGVSKRKGLESWRAEIHKNNIKYSLGSFKTEGQAALAYNAKAVELYGEFALLNKVDSKNG